MRVRPLTLASLLVVFALASCGGEQPGAQMADAVVEPTALPSDRLAVLESRVVEQGPDERGNGWHIQYAHVSGIDPAAADRVNAAIAAHLRLDALALPEGADQHDGLSWFEQVTVLPGLQTPQLLSMEFTSYIDTGGAHGMPGIQNLTFDLTTGDLLTVQQLLAPNAVEVLSPIVKGELDSSYGATHDASDEVLMADDTWAAGFDANGNLVIAFQPYSIGPYSLGMPEVTIAAQTLFESGLVPEGGLLASALADWAP